MTGRTLQRRGAENAKAGDNGQLFFAPSASLHEILSSCVGLLIFYLLEQFFCLLAELIVVFVLRGKGLNLR